MKTKFKILLIGLLLILSEIGVANKLIFKGKGDDALYWCMADIKLNDSLIKTVDIYNQLTVDSLNPGIYQVIFFSRFADRQILTVDLFNKKKAIIKLPSYKFYSINKSDTSFFDNLQDKDTLRIFFTQHDCFTGVPYDNFARIIKQNDTIKITYTKLIWETKTYLTLSNVLNFDQINYLKKIELGELEAKSGEGCTSVIGK